MDKTEDFITRARKIHGDRYDYSKVVYKNAREKVCIVCKEHGEFWQTPYNHLSGKGCGKCANNFKMDVNLFIQKAKQVHGDKYDYSRVRYKNVNTKVCIICPIHGEFMQTPHNHLNGRGCFKCGGTSKSNKETFIGKAKNVHNNRYDYSKVEYVNARTKVCIICPEHGEFWQIPAHHLRGEGCSKCRGKTLLTTEEFIKKAREVHGNRYDYSKSIYLNIESNICITCPIHGDFWQKPKHHLQGSGCIKCTGKEVFDTISFIKKANCIHNYKYDYSKVDYVNNHSDICIICPEHGEFWQNPNNHLRGTGCPSCSCRVSKPEKEIRHYVGNLIGSNNVVSDRKLLNGLECDVIVLTKKIAIEYNGLYWHSEAQGKDKNYHLHKTELAESKGYHLIHIFEDEWLEHKNLVLNKARHFLGCDIDKPVIGARKCVIKTVSKTLAEPFLVTYHLQGFVSSTTYYGAFYGDILVGVMTFKQEKPDIWNLTRFATNTDYRLPGLASKIFKQFIKDNNPMEVKAFLDRRWSHCNENVYDRMGFKLVETLAPDYRYVVRSQRVHKFNFRKQIIAKEHNFPLIMTEKEMVEQLGYYRIWDCGLYKYIWKNEKFK